ncbi:hypothetical protein [Salinicola halophilus]|uniref:hypothetical protein n=1 Tax=Salinicola halophilus TaxID=184065 RepID=UPI000DA1E2DE|nr:hypothetical protein [Salinicola halophilus]
MTHRIALRLTLCALGLALMPPAFAQPSDAPSAGAPTTNDSSLEIQEDSGEVQAPANASQVDRDSIERSGGVGRENAGFTDGGAQTPVDQRPNALSFDQLDVDGDGVIDEQEAVSAQKESLYRQLSDEAAGGVTRSRFEQAVGSDTLSP